jgi:hypothetical protein
MNQYKLMTNLGKHNLIDEIKVYMKEEDFILVQEKLLILYKIWDTLSLEDQNEVNTIVYMLAHR